MRTLFLICTLLSNSAFAKRTPWNNSVAVSIPSTNPGTQGGTSDIIAGTLPAGYTGTVTHVSAQCRTRDAAVSVDEIAVRVPAKATDPGELAGGAFLSGPYAEHPLILIHTNSSNFNSPSYVASGPMMLMVGAGDALSVQINITNNGASAQGAFCVVSISGYVDEDISSKRSVTETK